MAVALRCICAGFNDMVELLVSQGVDVNAVSYSGVTALMLAAQQVNLVRYKYS